MAHDVHEARDTERRRTGESFLVRFAREFGWRAYAIPVLFVITAWLVYDIATGDSNDRAVETAPGSPLYKGAHESGDGKDNTGVVDGQMIGPDPALANSVPPNLVELPPGGPYTEVGDKTYRTIGVPGAAAGEGTEKVLTYIVQVENGVDTSVYGGDDAIARFIDATLTDPRGWTHDPRFRLQHVAEKDNPELTIRLASTRTAAETCGAQDFSVETSCRTTMGGNEVVINDARWSRGAYPFEGDLGTYRQYVINHEVGHALGYDRHSACGADGALAPIMMQQTISLDNSVLASLAPQEIYPDDRAVCRYNGWPYPTPAVGPTG